MEGVFDLRRVAVGDKYDQKTLRIKTSLNKR